LVANRIKIKFIGKMESENRIIEVLAILSAMIDPGILVMVLTKLKTDCRYPSIATTVASLTKNSLNIYGITGPHKVSAKEMLNVIIHSRRDNELGP